MMVASAYAQAPVPLEKPPVFKDFCGGAETPADLLSCTNQRKEKAQAQLRGVYNKLVARLGSAEGLTEAQNAWITYRNLECAFETRLVEADNLKRMQELSCVSRLSEMRALALHRMLSMYPERIVAPSSPVTQ